MKEKTVVTEVKRWIGIRPRIKGLGGEDNPPRPTEVCVLCPDGQSQTTLLETEQDELDYVHGLLPTGYREVRPGEDISSVPAHQVIHDDPKEAESKGRPVKPDRIPSGYIGLEAGDLVGMSLGGLGDMMAYAISRHGEKNGFAVKRLPPYELKAERKERQGNKDADAGLLAQLIREKPELFRELAERDRAMVNLRQTERLRRFSQGDRKACAMRIRSATLGEIFCSDDGGYPEGGLEKAFKLALASDPVLMALKEKEAELTSRLKSACEQIPIYQAVKPLAVGAGPSILGGIIAAVQDIGLFPTPGKFKAFCGIHVLKDGSFPRHQVGQRCNWNPNARQAFFNLGDQFNRREGTFWGDRLLANKAEYKRKHPHAILVSVGGEEFPLIEGRFKKKGNVYTFLINKEGDAYTFLINPKLDGELKRQEIIATGKQKYFNGHLHKMAYWKTVQEFAEWLFWKWRTIEGYPAHRLPKIYPPDDEAEIKRLTAESAAAEPSPDQPPSAMAAQAV